MRDKLGALCIGLGLLLIFGALALFGYNRLEDRRAGAEAESYLPRLVEFIEAQDAAPATNLPPELQEETEQTAEIDGYSYIGFLSIPALDLELPVMSEWDYAKLRISPCRYVGSAKTDDLVIAAHNYSRHFGNLSKLAPGDAVYFTDMEGTRYTYTAEVIETLEPDAIDEMIDSDYALTLFTCTYGGQMRVTVRCSRQTGIRNHEEQGLDEGIQSRNRASSMGSAWYKNNNGRKEERERNRRISETVHW